jgi:hypothetical protein
LINKLKLILKWEDFLQRGQVPQKKFHIYAQTLENLMLSAVKLQINHYKTHSRLWNLQNNNSKHIFFFYDTTAVFGG